MVETHCSRLAIAAAKRLKRGALSLVVLMTFGADVVSAATIGNINYTGVNLPFRDGIQVRSIPGAVLNFYTRRNRSRSICDRGRG